MMALLLAAPSAFAQIVFEPPMASFVAGGAFTSSAEADINGDGLLDLVFSGNSPDTYALLGSGGGAFSAPSAIVFPAVDEIMTVDLNGDGDVDLAGLSVNILSTALGNGDGTFGPVTMTTLDDFAFGVSFGEWTGDAFADLVIEAPTFIGFTPLRVLVRPGLGNGTFGAATAILDEGAINSATTVTGDLDGDGATEVIVFETDTTTQVFTDRRIFSISPAGVGTQLSNVPVLGGAEAFVTEAQLVDVNSDGDLDLVAAVRPVLGSGMNVEVSLGAGDGSFAAPSSVNVDVNVIGELNVADYSGDGIVDIALIALNTGTVNLFLGQGDGTFTPNVIVSLGSLSFIRFMSTSDFDADGRPDLLVVDSGFPTTTELRVLRNFTYGASEPILDLGQASPGSFGFGPSYPIQLVESTLQPNADVFLELHTVTPGLPTWLVVGVSELSIPLGKATLVPSLDLVVGPLTMPAAGGLLLEGRWPIGLPPGFEIWAQFIIKDPGVMLKIAASNAVLITNP